MMMDGLAVQTCSPFENEVLKRKDYRLRKGGFAIIALAGYDADARFILAAANHSGSTNDILHGTIVSSAKWLSMTDVCQPSIF